MPSSNTISVICESLSHHTESSADTLKNTLNEEDQPANFSAHIIRNNSCSNNDSIRNRNNNIVTTSEDRRGATVAGLTTNITTTAETRRVNDEGFSHEKLAKQIQYYLYLIASYVDMERIKDIFLLLGLTIYGLIYGLVLALIPRSFRFKDVSGQVVLITGAGSGIGRLMAKKFAIQHGCIAVVWDINQQGMDETVKEIRAAGGKCHGYIVDVTSKDKIFEAAEKVKKEVGKVDILINNAGIVSGSRFLDTKDSMIERTFQVNALANFWTCKAFLPDMLKTSRGHIVTIASSAGLTGVNRLVDYCSSKYAAVGFHEALLNELRSEGRNDIHATLVCPYYINTGMFDGVKSKLLPILKPDDVVDDIVAAVLSNQEMIVIPRYVLYLCLFKNFIPSNIEFKLQTLLGITGTMLTFKGRGHGPAEAQKTK